jgi:hypothetical protein
LSIVDESLPIELVSQLPPESETPDQHFKNPGRESISRGTTSHNMKQPQQTLKAHPPHIPNSKQNSAAGN